MRSIVAIFALLVAMSNGCKAGLPEPPIEFRLSSLGGMFRKLNAAKPNEEIIVGRLIKRGAVYALSWNQPDRAIHTSGEDILPSKVVDIAVDTLRDKLPDGLRPEKERLLSLGRYKVGLRATDEWIWVAEFQVTDESPVGGIGFMPTLFVPVSIDGAVLLSVNKVEN